MNNRFVILIPSYQNRAWCEKNLLSALDQNYSNFRVVYVDDCSTDGTADEIERILSEHDKKNKVTLIRNNERCFMVGNVYNIVHCCDDDEIVITLDGDDWLANNNVLSRVNREYNKSDVWITYGQFKSYPENDPGCSCEIPKHIIDNGLFRRYRWCSSHLRTYYAWLFKMIRKEDLMHNGEWIKTAGDLAIMFPMLEMAGPRQSFISDILYIYNHESPINDDKVNRQMQINMEMRIRRNLQPYKKI